MKGRGRCATLAACVLCAAPAVATSAQAAFPGANGRIAFTSYRDQTQYDIYSINSDGTGELQLTADPATDAAPAWSPDGSKIAFTSNRGGSDDIWVMDADGSSPIRLTDDPASDVEPAWAPDGTQIVFSSTRTPNGIYVMDADGANETHIGESASLNPAWSPDGQRIAFSHVPPEWVATGSYDLYTMKPDGSDVVRLTATRFTSELSSNWAPDGGLLVMWARGQIHTIKPDGSDKQTLPIANGHYQPAWSPEGSNLVMYSPPGRIAIYSEIGTQQQFVTPPARNEDPDWQPLPPPPTPVGYPRPKGATPISTALVPAYRACDTPDREHGPPLAFPSCSAPALASEGGYLTVGTADSNGKPTRFAGSVVMEVLVGDPTTPGDQADVAIRTDIADVRCKADIAGACVAGPLSDYSGELQGTFPLRITDKLNGHTQTVAATVSDVFGLPFTIPCTPTADPDAGAGCSLQTTADALLPGVAVEGRRAVWELGEQQVLDGGADGQAATDDNTAFLTQGIFVP